MPDRVLFNLYRFSRRIQAHAHPGTVETRDGRHWPIYHRHPGNERIDRGVPVVFFHGFGNDGTTWFPFMETLGEMREIVAPDLPGFGGHPLAIHPGTARPAVSPTWYRQVAGEFLRELTIRWGQPPIVVGKSMGAMIAGLVAGDLPHLVRKLVLIDPAGIETPSISPFWRAYGEGTNLLIPHTAEEWDRMVAMLYHRPPRIPGFLRREALRTIARNRTTYESVFSGLLAEGYDPLGQRLHMITSPVAVIWGANDQVMDPSGVDVVRERIPHASIHLLPDCGHSPTRERPDSVCRILVDVFSQYG